MGGHHRHGHRQPGSGSLPPPRRCSGQCAGLLAICQCAERYNRAVKQGCWQLDIPESIGLLPQMELYGKTYGVYGYGSIGRQSARIARAFGMEVLVCTRTVRPEYAADGVEFVDYDTLLRRWRR